MLNVLSEVTRRASCVNCYLSWLRYYATEAPARITVPHRMLQKITKEKSKHSLRKHQSHRNYKGQVVISCQRKQLNHHKGQTYSNFNPNHLASGGWKHQKSKGDYFTINAIQGNPAVELEEEGPHRFTELGLHSKLVEGLSALGIKKPTNIQALTIPQLLSGKSVLCAAETGSGKTLAYLLPALERIYQHKKLYGPTELHNQPHCVVLTPSRELADQIYRVTEELAKFTPFVPHSVCGGRGTQKLLHDKTSGPIDLLIATPGVLSKLLTNRMYDMSGLQLIVLDEADTLLDDSFSPLTKRIIRKMKVVAEKEDLTPHGDDYEADYDTIGTQLALVGATMPRSLEEILEDIVPMETVVKVTTSHLHRLMPHVPQKFMRLGPSQKPEAVLKVLKTNEKRQIPTIVFCNNTKTLFFLKHFLTDNNVSHLPFHGSMSEKLRQGTFEQFQNGECDILLCTDIASRGLDTIRAQHIVNYDFPDFMSDYIHRVGRVGRVGSHRTGFALNFVCQKWEVDLLWKIEAAARRVTELQNVNANIKRRLVGLSERRAAKGTADLSEMMAHEQH